jgi:hypothetical protein
MQFLQKVSAGILNLAVQEKYTQKMFNQLMIVSYGLYKVIL